MDELEEADEPTSEAQGIVHGKPVYEHCLYDISGGLPHPKHVVNNNPNYAFGTTHLVSDMLGWVALDGRCYAT